MKYTTLGQSDLKASVIGLGTAQFGSTLWGYNTKYTKKDAINLTKAAINEGINIFDTAELYSDTRSEQILGEALQGYDRNSFIVITKAAPWNLRYNKIIYAAEKSIKRLKTQYIDIYLIHYPSFFTPLDETMKAMQHLQQQGIIHHIGLSNFPKFLIKKVQDVLTSSKIIANEIEYNLICRKEERTTIPFCRNHKISIITHSPLARGILTGRYSSDNYPIDRARAFYPYAKKGYLKKIQPLLNEVHLLAKEKDVSFVQIALAYIIRNPSFFSIPAAMKTEEIKENAEVPNIHLSETDVARIESHSTSLNYLNYFINYYLIWPFSWVKASVDMSIKKNPS